MIISFINIYISAYKQFADLNGCICEIIYKNNLPYNSRDYITATLNLKANEFILEHESFYNSKIPSIIDKYLTKKIIDNI